MTCPQCSCSRASTRYRLADDNIVACEFHGWPSKIGVQNGSLLDVGCGLGTFLGVARDDGWRVAGLDISPFAAKTATAAVAP